jgi:hypothetical protein
VRVSTAFNTMLAIPGASVTGVRFEPSGVVVGLRLRARRLRCPCGFSTPAGYDSSRRRWRHLDLGAAKFEDVADAPEHLDWWLAWACRSRIPSFVALSAPVRANRERILAAAELGLSNSKLEGLNSKIRLINHRGYGHHSAAAVIAMIYLCCGGITIALPFN